MNLDTNTSAPAETLPDEAHDDYTVRCLVSRDQMNATGYAVSLCGRREKSYEVFTGRSAHVVPCPICNAILSDPAFRDELISYSEKHIRPYCGGGDDSHTATD